MSKKNNGSRVRLVGRFLRGSTALFVLSIICALIAALADMVTPQIIRAAVDNVITKSTDDLSAAASIIAAAAGGLENLRANAWIMAAAVVAVAVVKVASQYGFQVLGARASETMLKTMRDMLFSHIQRLPFSWHMKNRTGDIIQRCTSDIDMIKNFVSEQLTNVFRTVLMLVLSFVFMFSMNVWLTLIALAPVPFIVGYSLLFHKRIERGFIKCDENEGRLSAMVQENLTGVRVVRAFGQERLERDRFEAHNEYYTGLWERLARVMSRFWSVSDILSGLQLMLVVVFGSVFCINGGLSSGEYIAFISYNGMMTWPIRQLGRMISEMSKAGVSVDRLLYIMESAPEQDKPDAADADMSGDIAFEDVSFAYEGCPEVLHDISFTIRSGETIGILGGTGSGKSTLMLLLDKLYSLPENCGRITIGGVDIADIRTEHLRRNIGIVLQEPYLFSRTIAENIAISDSTLTLDDVRSAAEAACLDSAVSGFTNGYDTFVGERGVTLSGGQKQRAAIARNLTRNAPIMIFDDSLSAVDTETDAKIRAALEKRFGTATTIIISHRITTLCKADRILVLDGGRISDIGTHEELISREGIYRKIYETQTGTEVNCLD